VTGVFDGLFDGLARPFLRAFDPEYAHTLTLKMLRLAPLLGTVRDDKRLAVRAFALNFPNPVGMAAGFDKNAEVPDALLRLGFGFVEVGTITPKPQRGNSRPRVFRLDADGGVINRLGFNSQGADAVLRRLAARAEAGGIVGINVGANRDTPDRAADYVELIERFASVASYVTVNVSSPNTPGLRDLQQATALDDLLARVVDARERVVERAGPTPLLLKIAPDLSLAGLDDIVGIARSRRVDGMIVGNTTVSRPPGLVDTARAIVRAVDPDAGGDQCAGRRRVPPDRRRRHRFRRGGDCQSPRRREPRSALFGAGVPRPWASFRDQDGPDRCA
jgi:dihydroorotate dehydrogenase